MLYVDDKLTRHLKIFKAGALLGENGPAQALALYMDGLSYARSHLTDGFLPDKFVSSCGLVQTPQSVAKALSSRGVKLWHRVRGGYRIHDYHDWNKKASEIKKKQREERDKKRKQREVERHVKDERAKALSLTLSPRDNSQTSRARASTIHVPRTTSTTTDSATSESEGKVVPKRKAAAAPPCPAPNRTLLNPKATEPAADGNFAVIERIAHEALDELQRSDPGLDVVERVKELCAQRRIDYGRAVASDVVHAAVKSAATQRTLLPVQRSSARARGGEPSSLGELVSDFRVRLERMREQSRRRDAN